MLSGGGRTSSCHGLFVLALVPKRQLVEGPLKATLVSSPSGSGSVSSGPPLVGLARGTRVALFGTGLSSPSPTASTSPASSSITSGSTTRRGGGSRHGGGAGGLTMMRSGAVVGRSSLQFTHRSSLSQQPSVLVGDDSLATTSTTSSSSSLHSLRGKEDLVSGTSGEAQVTPEEQVDPYRDRMRGFSSSAVSAPPAPAPAPAPLPLPPPPGGGVGKSKRAPPLVSPLVVPGVSSSSSSVAPSSLPSAPASSLTSRGPPLSWAALEAMEATWLRELASTKSGRGLLPLISAWCQSKAPAVRRAQAGSSGGGGHRGVHTGPVRALHLLTRVSELGLVPPESAVLTTLLALARLEAVDSIRDLLALIRQTPPLSITRGLRFQSLADSLARAGHFKAFEVIVEEANRAGVKLTVVPFSILLTHFSKKKDLPATLTTFDLMSRSAIEPNLAVWTQLLNAYAREGNAAGAARVMKALIATGAQPDVRCLTALAKAYGNAGDVSSTLGVLSMIDDREHNPFTYNALIKAHMKAGDAAAAWATLRRMREKGVRPTNPAVFNDFASGFAAAGDVASVLAVVKEMEAHGVERDIFTLGVLANAYAQAGDVDGVKGVLAECTTRCFPPNVYLYSALVTALGKSGDVAGASAAFRDMEEKGVRANAHVFTALTVAYGVAGDAAGAQRVVDTMVGRGIRPTMVTFGGLINAYAQKGDVQGAEGVRKAMVAADCPPNADVLYILVHAYTNAGDVVGARALMRDIEAMGFPLTINAYGALLKACSVKADTAAAKEVWEEVQAKGIATDSKALASLLTTYAKGRDRGGVSSTLSLMEKFPLDSNLALAKLHAANYLSDWSLVVRVMREMEAAALPRTAVWYCQVFDTCGYARRLPELAAFADDMRRDVLSGKVHVEANTVTSLVEAYARNGDHTTAATVVSEMLSGSWGRSAAPTTKTLYTLWSFLQTSLTAEEAAVLSPLHGAGERPLTARESEVLKGYLARALPGKGRV